MNASLANDSQLITALVGLPGVNEAPHQIPYQPLATPGPTSEERGRSRTPPGPPLRDNTARNGQSPGKGSATPTSDTERKCQFCPVVVK